MKHRDTNFNDTVIRLAKRPDGVTVDELSELFDLGLPRIRERLRELGRERPQLKHTPMQVKSSKLGRKFHVWVWAESGKGSRKEVK